MKFVMLPTYPVPPANYTQRGDTADFLALPMPGKRVADLSVQVADMTIHPVIVPMETLCKWWHKVREWRVILNHPKWPANQPCVLSLNESDTIDEGIVQDMPTGWANVGSADPFDWFRAGYWTGTFTYTDHLSFVRTVAITLSILRKKSVTISEVYYLTGDFTQILPYLRLQIEIEGLDGNSARGDTANFYDESPVTTSGDFSANIDGFTPTVVAACATGSGFESDPLTMDLSPYAYWPYEDAGGGNPKYNALTGAKL